MTSNSIVAIIQEMDPTKDLLLKFNYAITFKSRLTRLKRVIFLFVVLVAPDTLGGGLT